MKLWVCGRYYPDFSGRWDFQGVFDSEEQAVSACKDDWYFVGPVTLNEELPEETESWPGHYYPVVIAEMGEEVYA